MFTSESTETNNQSRYHQIYWVPVISSIIVFLINFFIALFNPVTTFCIADVITRNSSRFVETVVAVMFSFIIVLLLLKKGNLLVIVLSITAIALQFSLLGYITYVNKMELCNFISRKWSYVGISITLVGAFINKGYLYFKYLALGSKKPKSKIIWQLIGALVYVSIVAVLFYLGLDIMYNI